MANPKSSDGRSGTAALRALHERFVQGDVDSSELDGGPLRPVVASSWQRSLAEGVDPDQAAAQSTSRLDEVLQARETHPLASALPVVRQLLVQDAVDAGVVVAVTAADGTLLWVEGDQHACRRASAMNFVPGADWSERGAGTNAPGTALALDQAVQIRGSEHFSRLVQPWSCTAVPVHNRDSGAAIGAIDVTGGARVGSPETLSLMRAAAFAVESHLALLSLSTPPTAQTAVGPRLEVLGSGRPRWVVTDQNRHEHVTRLTGRHAEILVLLSRHPEGVTADHLALLLDDKELDGVTVRVEMSRLRRVIGAEFLASRPYRLLRPFASDLVDVWNALDTPDVHAAIGLYSGPLLSRSVSPAIARLRTELSTGLRAAVLATGDSALLRRWLESPEGRDDRDGWRLLRDSAQACPATRARASGHLAGIDFELG